MSKHTPGRLSVDEYPVTLANGDLAHAKLSIVAPSKDPRYLHFSIGMVNFSAEFTGLYPSDVEEAEANARRLVACWNACVGMETDALEQISRTGWIAGGKAIAKAEAILAATEPSADAVEAAFREGFRSPTTYNDTVMNSEDDAWGNSEARAEAAKAAPQPADDGWIPWEGGYIQSEENLHVSGNAWVYGNAQVYGNAWVSGKARVHGDAQVYGDAWVSGNAQVYGNAWVSGKARVHGDAQVYGDAWVFGDARVHGNGLVFWASKVGTENGTLTVCNTKGGGLLVIRGCFAGTPSEFLAASAKKHDARTRREYEMLIEVATSRIEAARLAHNNQRGKEQANDRT